MPHPAPRVTRRALLAGGGSLLAAGLTGCARGTGTRPAPAGAVTLNSDVPTWAPGFEAAGQALRRRTRYAILPRAVPNVSAYQQLIRMSSQTDSTTDLVKWWNGYRLQDLARGDVLTDLSAAWDAAERRGWVDRTLRAAYSYEGKAYAVPLTKSYYAVSYSKKAFARAGVAPPTTWDGFLDVCDRLRAEGVTPVGAAGANSWESIIWFTQVLAGADPDFYVRLCSGEARYTDPPAVAALRLWSRLYARKVFSPPDYDSAGTGANFKAGTVGMYLIGTWNTNAFITAGLSEKDFGLFLLPRVGGAGRTAVVVEASSLAVPRNAHKRDAAIDVAGAWLAADVQRAWVGFLKDTSPNPAVFPDVRAIRTLHDQVRRTRPVEVTRYWEASPPALVEGNANELSSFMVNPTEANVLPTLRRMQERAGTEWRLWNS